MFFNEKMKEEKETNKKAKPLPKLIIAKRIAQKLKAKGLMVGSTAIPQIENYLERKLDALIEKIKHVCNEVVNKKIVHQNHVGTSIQML